MRDGLYIVDYQNIYGAFVVFHGQITSCAPVLRKKLDYWKRRAKWCPTDFESQPLTSISQNMVDSPPGKE